jgi:hypothetical protein
MKQAESMPVVAGDRPGIQVAIGIFNIADSLIANKLEKRFFIQQFDNEIRVVGFELPERQSFSSQYGHNR